jgi:metacaspase-1
VGTGYSLHIGLNRVDPAHYAGWVGPLASCEADMQAMAALCGAAGFQSSSLATVQATREAVYAAIRGAQTAVRSGDTFVLTYAGHGGQVPDIRGGRDTDGKNETWCLFNGQFLDDELYALWNGFAAGSRVVVVSDSCHSATMHQFIPEAPTAPGPGHEARLIPPDVAVETWNENEPFFANLYASTPVRAAASCSGVMIGAAKDDEVSWGDEDQGLFTRALLQTWAGGAFIGSYRSLTETARQQTPSSPRCTDFGVAGLSATRPFAF